MQVKDPTEWFDDLSVHINDEELIEQAAALEPTLLHNGSRIGATVWIILMSAIAGAFGGFTFSHQVQSSWLIFIPYLIAGALLLRVLKPLSTRLLGPTVAWQAVLAFFWSCLLAMVAVLGARIETVWLSYAVSVAGGLFIGLMYRLVHAGLHQKRGGDRASPFSRARSSSLVRGIRWHGYASANPRTLAGGRSPTT